MAAALLAIYLSVDRPVRAASRPEIASFIDIYRDLVETDTTLKTGNCTAASNKMLARLKAAGFSAGDLYPYATEDHPDDGGLVAILRGRQPVVGAVLLMAHIDVVDVVPADWSRKPFSLTEEGGYFYGRGVSDDKAMAATLVDTLIHFHAESYRPRRDVKIALTCGEETADAFNGAEYLAFQRRDLIAADFALVPSGGATLDAEGRPVSLTIQAGEKLQQNFRLEARGTGSHASRPTADNAIYHLAKALLRIGRMRFPVEFNPVTRLYFERIATTVDPKRAAAIRALLANANDQDAEALVTADSGWNGMLRTTCVATVLEAGRTANTVPAQASANINCRLLPGHTPGEVHDVLTGVIADSRTELTPLPMGGASSIDPRSNRYAGSRTGAAAPPITPQIMEPITKIAADIWPNVAIIPAMLTGATDARQLNAAGIPAYGLTAVFNDPDGNGVHAANERVRVKSVLDGREFIYRLIKAYADEK